MRLCSPRPRAILEMPACVNTVRHPWRRFWGGGAAGQPFPAAVHRADSGVRRKDARTRADPAYRRGMETRPEPRRQPVMSRVVAGIIVMIVGTALLASRLDVDTRFSAHFWPLILIAMGLARLLDRDPARGGSRKALRAAWLLYVGLWGLVNEFHVLGFDYGTSWPLLVIGAGLAIVWRALDSPRPHADRQEQ